MPPPCAQLQEFCSRRPDMTPPMYSDAWPLARGYSCTVRVRDRSSDAILVEAEGSAATVKAAKMQAAARAYEQVLERYLAAARAP